jgi:hypothetical protein
MMFLRRRIERRKPLMKTAICLMFAGVLMTSACSTQTRSVRSESYESAPDQGPGTVVRKSETTETEKSTTESGGILSGTVDIVGKTLALPFRAVGGLIDLAF